MPLCPQNHLSDALDFCAVCGVEMRAPELPAAAAARCPVCDTPRESSRGAFCEVCGCDFATGATPVASEEPAPPNAPNTTNGIHASDPSPSSHESHPTPRWEIEARVLPDADPEAPRDTPPRVFPLDLPDLLIGRRSPRRGIAPEISLDGDDGISHRHARLRRRADGGWELLDLGSANGTARNGAPIEPHVPLVLQPGDCLRLGRWTELFLRSL